MKKILNICRWIAAAMSVVALSGALPAHAAGSGIVEKLFLQSGAGAVTRTQNSKSSDSVSVEDFGAVCNGVADTRAAIQAAVDEVFVRGGGVVEVPAKTCMVSAVDYYLDDNVTLYGITSIKLRDGVYLRGKGAASVIKVVNSAYGGGAFYRMISSRDTTRLSNSGVMDLTLDGNRANQVASVQASNLVIEAKSNVKILRVRSINANGNGIMVRGTTADYASDIEIADSTVINASAIGIQSSQFSGLRIVNNVVSGTGDNGIDIYGEDGTTTAHGQNFYIGGNQVDAALVGVFLETVRDGSVVGNTVITSTIGYTVNRINGQPRNIDIANNVSIGNQTGFRGTGDTAGVKVHHNIISGFSVAGAALGSGTAGNQSYYDLSENTFTPSGATVPVILLAGNQSAFNTGRNNIVIFDGMTEFYFAVHAAVTEVDNSFGGFRVLPGQVGPDLFGQYARFTKMELLSGSAANTAGPVTVAIQDYTCGKLEITSNQGGIGSSMWEQSYCKRAGVLTLGLPQKTIAGADPIFSIDASSGSALVTLLAANTYLSWGLHFIALQ